ncbi:MAG: hypothetical protein R3C49_16715 [Planctomycetaceae bacterium]
MRFAYRTSSRVDGGFAAVKNGSQKEALMLLVGKQSDGSAGDTPEKVEEVVSNAKSMFQALMPLLMEEQGHPR